MSEPIKYPVGTLADMAAIPEDRLHAFIAELPAMLASLRGLLKASEALEAMGLAKITQGTPTWCDDGETFGTVTLSEQNDDGTVTKIGSMTVSGERK